MNIKKTEAAIIDRLKAKMPELTVEGFPDDPVNYTLKSAKGALLVQYQGSTYKPPETFFISVQQTPGFDITIITKDLRTHTGAYAYLETVKAALTGFMIPDEGRMYPIEDGLRNYLENRKEWHYGISFGFNTVHEEAQ